MADHKYYRIQDTIRKHRVIVVHRTHAMAVHCSIILQGTQSTGYLSWRRKIQDTYHGGAEYRIPIMAAQNLSSSGRSSLSVGSTIRLPGTGQDIVGAWKPGEFGHVTWKPGESGEMLHMEAWRMRGMLHGSLAKE